MKKVIILALLLSFTGLNILPVLADDGKVTNTPKQFKSMVKKNKKTSDDYKFAYVNMDWWNNFDDDILKGYIEQAVINNYDLKMATLSVGEYYQAMKITFADELPQAGMAGGYGLTKMQGMTKTTGSFGLPMLVNYELDLFLKNRDKTRASKKMYEGAIQDERAAYIAVASAVGTVYLNIVNLDKMISLQEDIVSLRQEIYDLMLIRNKEGLTSTADTVKANKSLVAGQTTLVELKKEREKLLNELCVLIGDSPENSDKMLRITMDELNYDIAIPSDIPSEIIVQRPDYIKAELMVEKSGLDVRAAKKEFLPTINIGGLAFWNSSDLGSIFTTRNMLLGLGGGLLMPVFTGGKRLANVRLKKATYERILQNYYKTNLTAIQEINNALVSAKLDREKMEQTITQYNLEKSDYGYNEKKFNQGVISKLDLIQFRENLLNIEKLVAQQKAECMTDAISLYKATGSKY